MLCSGITTNLNWYIYCQDCCILHPIRLIYMCAAKLIYILPRLPRSPFPVKTACIHRRELLDFTHCFQYWVSTLKISVVTCVAYIICSLLVIRLENALIWRCFIQCVDLELLYTMLYYLLSVLFALYNAWCVVLRDWVGACVEKSEPVKAVFTLRLRPVIVLIMCAGHKTLILT